MSGCCKSWLGTTGVRISRLFLAPARSATVARIQIRWLRSPVSETRAVTLLFASISLCSLAASHHLFPARLVVLDQLARPDEAVQLEARLTHVGKLGTHLD